MQKVKDIEQPVTIQSVRNLAKYLHEYNEQYSVLEYEDVIVILSEFIQDALYKGYAVHLPGVCKFQQKSRRALISHLKKEPVFFPESKKLSVELTASLQNGFKKYMKEAIK